MTISEKTLISSTNSALSVLFSLILPGLGQFFLKRRERGLLIFLTSAVLAFLIYWSLDKQEVGKINIGGMTTSWLWLPFILFWAWNVLDAHALKANRRFTILPGILFIAIIVYVIAWQVTGVRLNRLVERFDDARIVAANLLNPDMITISVRGEDKICAWSCMYSYIGDKLAGRPTEGIIRPSDNLLRIIGSDKTFARFQMAGESRFGRARQQSQYVRCRHDDRNDRDGLDGNPFLDSSGHTGQFFGCS